MTEPDVFEREEIRRQDEAIWFVMSVLHVVGVLTACALIPGSPYGARVAAVLSLTGLVASLRLWADARAR